MDWRLWLCVFVVDFLQLEVELCSAEKEENGSRVSLVASQLIYFANHLLLFLLPDLLVFL